MEAIAAGQRPQETHRTQLAWLLSSVRGVAAFVLALAALFAGVGILYLIHQTGAFGSVDESTTPFRSSSSPARTRSRCSIVLIAWVPAGFVAGLALIALTRFGAVARTASLTVLAALIMLLAGAISDSVAVNDPLSPHLAPQLSRGGTWIAVAFFALGSLCAGLLPPRRGPSRR